MKLRYWLITLATTVATSSSFAAFDGLVSAPWAPNTGKTDEKNLYSILGFADNAALNAATTGQELWSTGIGNQTTRLIVEYAGNANINSFGIYDINNTGNKLELFKGAASAGASAVLTISGSTIQIGSGPILTLSGSGKSFGFYLGGASGPFYSQAAKNAGNEDHLVTVNKNGMTYFGWEDLAFAKSDRDYQDMVIAISAVPEPTTIIAGALLLLPLGANVIRKLCRRQTSG